MSDRSPVLLRGAMPATMAPGRANGLYVVVVGEGVCRPFLRGRSKQPSIPQIRFPLEVMKECGVSDSQTSGVSAIRRNVPSARCIGMHDHSYQGQPLGSTASKLSGPFPLESCSIIVRGCSCALGRELVHCPDAAAMSAADAAAALAAARCRFPVPFWLARTRVPRTRLAAPATLCRCSIQTSHSVDSRPMFSA